MIDFESFAAKLDFPHEIIGPCLLINADCMKVLPMLEAGSVDAVVTDPPYGIGYSSGHGSDAWGDGAIDGDGDTSARDRMIEAIGSLPALVFGSWRRDRPAKTRMLLVWDTLGALGMGDLQIPWKPSHQEIYVLGDRTGFAGKRESDVIRHPPVQSMAKNGRVHPFEKPIGLIRMLIEKMRGQCILDPFTGSGTTGVACIRTGRRFIGIELDPGYYKIACDRIRREWETHQGGPMFAHKQEQEPELPYGGET